MKRTYTQVVLDVEAKLDILLARTAPPPVLPPVVEPPEPPIDIPPVPSEPAAPGAFAWTRSRPFNPPAIVRTPADLVSARLMLPFTTDKRSAPMTFVPNDWPGNDDFSGDTEGALVNDASGEWLGGGDPHNMLVWAESHAALPNHWIDPATGRFFSILDNPKVSAYSKTMTFPATSTSPISMDGAHYPAVCFIPFLATGDQFYLEELQAAANYHQISQNPQWRENDRGLFTKGQARAWAWALRDTVAAYLATPEGDVPAPLLPRSYWKRIIDNNRDDFRAVWINGANPLAGCHFARMLNGTEISPWQQDWIGAVIGWMVWTGQFDDWRDIYDWQIQQAIARTDGKAFPRSMAIGYWWETTGVTDMASLAAVNGLTETPDGKFPVGFNTHYAESLRANLKIAMLNSVAEAEPCFAYVDSQVPVPPDQRWAV